MKVLMSRKAMDGHLIMGTVAIKRIQGLVFSIKDCRFRGLPITAEAFTVEEMENAMTNKEYCKEMPQATEPSVKDLGKFNPDDFEIHEDAFVNLLASSFGVSGEPLHYVIHDEEAPDEFESDEQYHMYQIPLNGNAYNFDNASVFRKLKAFLVKTPGRGSSLLMLRKMDVLPSWHGLHITTDKVNSASMWPLPRLD
jgi:hypothetical protein